MRCQCWFAVLLGMMLSFCSGARILVMIPTPGKSHAISFDRISEELGRRGDEVTLISCFPQPKPLPNVKEVVLPNYFEETMKAVRTDLFSMREQNPWVGPFVMRGLGGFMSEAFLEFPEIKEIINSDQKFDLVIADLFNTEAVLAGFSHRFQAPIIGLSTAMATVWSTYMVGTPSLYSVLPQMFLGHTSTKMSLMERTKNVVFGLYSEFLHSMYHLPNQEEIMRKHFGNDLPPLKDIIFNTSVVLVNYHPSFPYPRPYAANMIDIAGAHIRPLKPLPQDLQKYMDEAKQGVILFSMGSTLKSADMPKEKTQMILNAFAQLKENVLWKFEVDDLPNQPKNVKISKWLPQSDILGHPNLKLFITHGGFLSTMEATLRAVPIIGIPIFGDQPANMELAEMAGVGRKLDFDNLTTDSLFETIRDVIDNPRYLETVRYKSELLKDNPKSALDTAIYWIEFVIRHKGAHHLRSTALDLTWYQYYSVDVVLVLAAAVIVVLVLTISTVKLILKKLFKKSEQEVSKQKKKN